MLLSLLSLINVKDGRLNEASASAVDCVEFRVWGVWGGSDVMTT